MSARNAPESPEPPGTPGHGAPPPADAGSRLLAAPALVPWLLLLLLLGFTALRVRTALDDPNFGGQSAEAVLRSDPALLFYFASRIDAADGLAPPDFRADPRPQHPRTTDVPAEFTVGLEWVVDGAYELSRACGGPVGDEGFLLVALWTTSFLAMLASLAVFALVRELTGKSAWALGSTLLFLVLPANHRTIGFVLVREDLAFPLFALHLAALVRALRRPSGGGFLLAGLLAAGTLATWHASSFLLGLELALAAAACVARGVPGGVSLRRVLPGAAVVVAAALLVPALRHLVAALSPTLGLLYALLAAVLAAERGWGTAARAGAAAGTLAATLAALALVRAATGLGAGHDHVWQLLLAKAVHGGVLPTDPNELSFDTRLLWQGPFETLGLRHLRWCLGFGWLVLAGAALVAWHGRGRREPEAAARRDVWLARGLLLAALLSVPAAWAIGRLAVLAGLLVPAAAGAVLGRVRGPRARHVAVGALLLLLFQSVGFLRGLGAGPLAWYQPPGRQPELEALIDWIRHVGRLRDEPILTDFMNGPALLAHCGTPIVLQPKYETAEARERARRFLETYFHGTPAELSALARETYDCAYLLIDRYTLGWLSRYAGGLRASEPFPPGSPAAFFQSQDEAVLRGVAGYELVYRSPATILQSNGEPYDLYRLYRLIGPGPPR